MEFRRVLFRSEELRERADERLAKLSSEGWNGAQLYGRDPDDGVGGFGAFFLLLDDPEVYGLPPDPRVATKHLGSMWENMAVAAAVMAVGIVGALLGGRGLARAATGRAPPPGPGCPSATGRRCSKGPGGRG